MVLNKDFIKQTKKEILSRSKESIHVIKQTNKHISNLVHQEVSDHRSGNLSCHLITETVWNLQVGEKHLRLLVQIPSNGKELGMI